MLWTANSINLTAKESFFILSQFVVWFVSENIKAILYVQTNDANSKETKNAFNYILCVNICCFVHIRKINNIYLVIGECA